MKAHADGGETNGKLAGYRLANNEVETGKDGGAMVERNGLAVVGKQRANMVSATAAQTGMHIGVREGTTGRIVTTLARVWAVASPGAPASDAAEVLEAAEPAATGLKGEPANAERGKLICLRGGRGVAAGRIKAPARVEGRVGPVAVGRAERRTAEATATARVELPAFEVRFYRKYTEALLRRYMQMTMEAGRVPSMMGQEVLGGRASSYRIHGFDDAVNFRLDTERCLARLDGNERELLRRVSLQEYTQAEAAALIGISLRTCVQRYGRALDKLTAILLEMRLLEPFKGLSRG